MEETVIVEETQSVGPQTVAITMQSPSALTAEPGQFLRVTATIDDEEYSRFYTISSPDVDDTIEITVGIDPSDSGPFSQYLGDIESGSELSIAGPFGQHYYENSNRAVVLAGGPGIGPAVGIGDAADAAGQEVAIIYVSETATPAHRTRLNALADSGNDITIFTTASDSQSGVVPPEFNDAVADIITGKPAEQPFVYGFEDFITAATDALETADVNPDEAKIENFG
ncbi:FAD-dependent oxidoreductase [Haloquadratum walsbyi]|jgi:Flavodoxin reductases (ferredoxin-NADPH reductases) family 1|uniref:FAD/NAD binding oxidoreductase n=1 Tax=Haloquadratum walsbyi J07HQW2 TaxID=1238425 RepID=U1N130_9EURY|nr:FAD-dependent oxidoreductase [Haloquadratum walsbyi]ERG96539.1 MAG: FAD/NAD binding oxidoreductase [Haloquadratum walsbyi J07HQW2]